MSFVYMDKAMGQGVLPNGITEQLPFDSGNTVFNPDGSITETDGDNNNQTTLFEADGSILVIRSNSEGRVTMAKRTVFRADGSIGVEDVPIQ